MAETSPDIASLAAMGLTHPEKLTKADIKAVCASALRQFEPTPPDATEQPKCPICGIKEGEHKTGCTWTGSREG